MRWRTRDELPVLATLRPRYPGLSSAPALRNCALMMNESGPGHVAEWRTIAPEPIAGRPGTLADDRVVDRVADTASVAGASVPSLPDEEAQLSYAASLWLGSEADP